MNINQVEIVLKAILAYDNERQVLGSDLNLGLTRCITWVHTQQRARARRKAEFRLRAAEQREALR